MLTEHNNRLEAHLLLLVNKGADNCVGSVLYTQRLSVNVINAKLSHTANTQRVVYGVIVHLWLTVIM